MATLNEEDYIDMDLLCSSPNQQSREFEFKMSLTFNDKDSITSPADELFYQGKLLPLHHLPPPRHDIATSAAALSFPKCSTAPCTNTPLDSANISPSESCRVSCELNPDDYFFEWSSDLSCFINNHPTKKTWSKKLKHSILGQKLRASRVYLKSWFNKSNCSDDESIEKYFKILKRPFGLIGRTEENPTTDRERIQDNDAQRRSFSSTIKRHSPHKCLSSSSSNSSSSSSSSFSLTSTAIHDLHFLRRGSSATEIEHSIEAAIAHCKKSQSILNSTTSSKDAFDT